MAQDPYAQCKTSKVLSGLGQRLVTLSDTNKAALLSEATQLIHGDENRTRAGAMLSRLKELNPDVVQQFHPKQDALDELCLRMICSSTESRSDPQSPVDSVSSYIAVSYCWHYPQWPLPLAATPICDGWEISQPMVEAVMALRQPGQEEGVWLDKLCINQDDHADIAAHIGVMDAIYRSARRVAILLEDVQLEKVEEDAGLAYAGFYEDLGREIMNAGLEDEEKLRFMESYFPRREQELRDRDRGDTLEGAMPFIKKMLGARWFGRGWCAHESRVAKHQRVNNPLFLCFGSDGRVLRFEFRFIHYLGLRLYKSESLGDLSSREFIDMLNDPVPSTLHQFWWRINRLLPNPAAGVSDMQHLVNILSFGCFKKGDLLSIALNTAGIPLYFDGGDVRCVEEVIWKFTVLVLASGDLLPLVAVGQKLRLPAAGRDVISWATNPNQEILEDPVPNPLPESITAITREYIELDLLVFECAPQQASLESKAKATSLIADYNLSAIANDFMATLPEGAQTAIRVSATEMTRLRPNTLALPTFQHRLISIALDNGLDWILNFPSAVQQTSAGPSFWAYGPAGHHANPVLTDAAQTLLSLLPRETTAPSPPDHDSTLLQKATHALTTLLDPRLILLSANPRRLPLSRRLGTAAITNAVLGGCSIAVPAALAHLRGRCNRAWVVEPFDPARGPHEDEAEMAAAECRIVGDGEVVEEGNGGGAGVVSLLIDLDHDRGDRGPHNRVGERGAWRVRRRDVLYGCFAGLWGAEGVEMLRGSSGEGEGGLRGGEGVVLLRRQRVYGGEDYPWGKMLEAVMRGSGDRMGDPQDLVS